MFIQTFLKRENSNFFKNFFEAFLNWLVSVLFEMKYCLAPSIRRLSG